MLTISSGAQAGAVEPANVERRERERIEDLRSEFVPEDQVTLYDLSRLKRWDRDSLSLRSDPPDAMAPYDM